ncbi:hypothetical protein AB0878_44925 [Amycolatopsis sp. NPDC047767]|uniref:hypothetical protein n=1 Tax=Amycolatopsis sp. NPDC047767 TaxID=3156765 RepID=UPI003456CE99
MRENDRDQEPPVWHRYDAAEDIQHSPADNAFPLDKPRPVQKRSKPKRAFVSEHMWDVVCIIAFMLPPLAVSIAGWALGSATYPILHGLARELVNQCGSFGR